VVAARSALAGVVTVLLIAACGGSSHSKHATADRRASVCLPAARAAAATDLGLAPTAVATSVSRGNNTYLQCTYKAPGRHGTAVAINVDTGPQPYFVLERTAIEASQVFTVNRLIPAPVAVTNLGIEADWFPATDQLMCTDGIKLITANVTWRDAKQHTMEAIAIAMSRPYLRQPNKRQRSHATGFPSG
jgi:hypothetical protein